MVLNVLRHVQIAELRGLSSAGQEAQDFLCQHGARMHRLADISEERRRRRAQRNKQRELLFAWVSNQQVAV